MYNSAIYTVDIYDSLHLVYLFFAEWHIILLFTIIYKYTYVNFLFTFKKYSCLVYKKYISKTPIKMYPKIQTVLDVYYIQKMWFTIYAVFFRILIGKSCIHVTLLYTFYNSCIQCLFQNGYLNTFFILITYFLCYKMESLLSSWVDHMECKKFHRKRLPSIRDIYNLILLYRILR